MFHAIHLFLRWGHCWSRRKSFINLCFSRFIFFFISVPECRQSEGECDDLIVYLMMLWGVWLRWVWWPPRWTTSSSTFPSSPAIWQAQPAISRRSLLVYCSCLHMFQGELQQRLVLWPFPAQSSVRQSFNQNHQSSIIRYQEESNSAKTLRAGTELFIYLVW